jgi:hypothetical protein
MKTEVIPGSTVHTPAAHAPPNAAIEKIPHIGEPAVNAPQMDGREATTALGRQNEPTVNHAELGQDTFAHLLIKAPATHRLDGFTDDIGVDSIIPSRAGLEE